MSMTDGILVYSLAFHNTMKGLLWNTFGRDEIRAPLRQVIRWLVATQLEANTSLKEHGRSNCADCRTSIEPERRTIIWELFDTEKAFDPG